MTENTAWQKSNLSQAPARSSGSPIRSMLAIVRQASDQLHTMAQWINSADTLLHSVETTNPAEQAPSNRYLSADGGRAAIGGGSLLRFGVVQEAIPYTNAYRVAPATGDGPVMICCLGRDLAPTPLSIADCRTILPGAMVYYVKHAAANYGVILGVEPPFMVSAKKARSDFIVQGSNVGLHKETFFKYLFGLLGSSVNSGIIDWSANQPVDSLGIGEFTKTAPSGIQLHLDAEMAHLRVDELCGLFLNYWDGLARLAGHQLQLWSSGVEEEHLNDEGEIRIYRGIAVYPWEQLGALHGHPLSIFREFTSKECQNSTPWYSNLEPKTDHVQPFHRVQRWEGYLGQGSKLLICGPPEQSAGREWNEYNKDIIFPGLFESGQTLAGQAYMRSATGIAIVKRPTIPIPTRKQRPESRTGDTANDYRASGQFGGGLPHQVAAEPSGGNAQKRVLSVADFHAYLFNWGGAHPFDYHENDFFFPEDDEVLAGASPQPAIDYTVLATGELPEPESTSVKIDDRFNEIPIFHNMSYTTLLPDGSVVHGDGFGGEIRLTRGHIYIDAPGDVWLRSGRNLQLWAGRDVILKAKRSIDITATNNDVRVKAQHNLHLLAATDGGPYSILLDCRSEETSSTPGSGHSQRLSGIICHAPKSEVLVYGDNIYLRTGAPGDRSGGASGGLTAPSHGVICLDAAAGNGNVVLYGHNIENFANCAVVQIFPGGTSCPDHVNYFSHAGNVLGEKLYVAGNFVNTGLIISAKDMVTVTGHFFSPTGGAVATGGEQGQSAVSEGIAFNGQLQSWAETEFVTMLEELWYTGRPGDDAVMRSYWAHLRPDSQYGSVTVPETRWGQLARLGSVTMPTWKESVVYDHDGNPTAPFPGYNNMQNNIYVRCDWTLVDPDTGHFVGRGAAYESATYGSLHYGPLDNNYPVVE